MGRFSRNTARPAISNPAPMEHNQERHLSVAEAADYDQRSFMERLTPVIACGAGLFSDGFLNQIISPVNTIFTLLHPTQYAKQQSNITALVFVGEVIGIFFFGYTSDHFSRKWSLFASTIILLVFAALCAGAYGAGGSIGGLFAAFAAYRFLLGIGIGGEYPAGSVGAAEGTGELKSGSRNRWFIFFSNFQIDLGFVVAGLVSMAVIGATGQDRTNLEVAWRVMLGLGVLPPLSLVYMRFKLQEPEAFKRESMVKAKTPWKLVFQTYWLRLLMVATIWFIYDFSSYAFSTYSSQILLNVTDADTPLWQTFGWSTLINFFYIPGSFAGAFISDWIGPRKTLVWGVYAQAIVGFIMAGVVGYINHPQYVAAFVVVYGIFLSLGELGPGDNIGLVASKTCPTAIRGQYYALAAAGGKIGAFIGTYIFPIVIANASTPTKALQNPFWIASSLAILSGTIALIGLPEIGQDTIDAEDEKFRMLLQQNGLSTSKLGLVMDARRADSSDSDISPSQSKEEPES